MKEMQDEETKNLFQSSPDKKLFEIAGLSSKMMQHIIDFADTGSMSVTKHDAKELFLAADMLEITGITEACCSILEEQLSPEKCIGIWQLTNTFSPPQLHHKAFCYTAKNFEEVASSKEYQQLSVQELTNILSIDHLNVKGENVYMKPHFGGSIMNLNKEKHTWLYSCRRILFQTSPDKKLFEIAGLSSKMMQHIIDFVYTGSMSVTRDDAQELFLAANMLEITGIREACCSILEDQLSPEKCIGIWQLTNTFSPPQLHHKAFRYITKNLEEVASSEEFQQLSVQELTDILSSDHLNVKGESIVYDAIHRWVNHAPEQRQTHFAVLLSKVRLALTTWEYILTVKSNALVKSNECQRIVHNAIKLKYFMSPTISHFHGCFNPTARPRLPNAILLAIGGWNVNKSVNDIETYDICINSWINVTSEEGRDIAYQGITFHNYFIYCIGGLENMEYTNNVRKLDMRTLTWHESAPMHSRRCYVSTTKLNEYIYAIGGRNSTFRLNTAERYRPETNQWSFIAPMNQQRSDASCTTLNNKIYICGGFNGQDFLNTCEYYSPEPNQWTFFTPMINHRSGLGVVSYANQVFAVGGCDGNLRLRSAEAYSPYTNTWHEVSTMSTPRSNFGIEVLDNKLFVVGGFNSIITTNAVEYYDVNTNMWYNACDMHILRSALACCVVSDLPNMAKYTISRDDMPFVNVEEIP